MGGEPARACGGARGLDGEAGTGGGEAGELVVVGLRAIRSEKARVCGFDEPSSFFSLAVWEREGEADGAPEMGLMIRLKYSMELGLELEEVALGKQEEEE